MEVDELTTRPTEAEIAEAIRQANGQVAAIIRRLAFERDSLKGSSPRVLLAGFAMLGLIQRRTAVAVAVDDRIDTNALSVACEAVRYADALLRQLGEQR